MENENIEFMDVLDHTYDADKAELEYDELVAKSVLNGLNQAHESGVLLDVTRWFLNSIRAGQEPVSAIRDALYEWDA